MDFAYIASQTFGDSQLECELLELFRAQAQRLVPPLPTQEPRGQAENAHLLKGSARAIGALRVASAAEAYEQGAPAAREASGQLYQDLVSAVRDTGAAIEARLLLLKSGSPG